MSNHNPIQFQKGIGFKEYQRYFGTEELCKQALRNFRWPDGFVCPTCKATKGHVLRTRPVIECACCKHQTSLTASTLFHSTKLPLSIWFFAMFLMSQSKTGTSALELSRLLGVNRNTAWMMKQKLMAAAADAESTRVLKHFVEVDDAYMGGRCPGQKVGRGSPNKIPFVIAVERNEKMRPRYCVLSVLPNFRKPTIYAWAVKHLAPTTFVASDGLRSFAGIRERCDLHAPVACTGRKAVQDSIFKWSSTVLGNLKTSLAGVHHRAHGYYLHRYFGLFQFRFNRRFNLKELLWDFLKMAACAEQKPLHELRLA